MRMTERGKYAIAIIALVALMATWLVWAAKRDDKLLKMYDRFLSDPQSKVCLQETSKSANQCWKEYVERKEVRK